MKRPSRIGAGTLALIVAAATMAAATPRASAWVEDFSVSGLLSRWFGGGGSRKVERSTRAVAISTGYYDCGAQEVLRWLEQTR